MEKQKFIIPQTDRWDPALCTSYNNQTPNAQPQVQQSKFLLYKNDSDNKIKRIRTIQFAMRAQGGRRRFAGRDGKRKEGQGNVRSGGERVLIARWLEWLSRIILLCYFVRGPGSGRNATGERGRAPQFDQVQFESGVAPDLVLFRSNLGLSATN